MGVLTVLIFTLSMILYSCNADGNPDNGDNTATTGSNDNPASESEPDVPAEPVKLPHDMPERDYKGYNFKFLVKDFDGNGYWGAQDIFAEEENGDPINDAVYKRNRIVENRYNVNISEIRAGSDYGAVTSKAKKA